MQENIIIKAPSDYDWTTLKNKERGFLTQWCDEHSFNFNTAYQLVHGLYQGGAGPKIRVIIEAALKEGLITEYRQAA